MPRDSKHPRPLIVGREDDPHVEAVVAAVLRRSSHPLVLDVSLLECSDLELSEETLVLPGREPDRLDLGCSRRGWLRRLVPAGWDHDLRIGSHEAAVKASWLSLLAFVIRSSDTDWLTGLDAVVAAENKLLQYGMARHCGVPVPRTAVCSDPHRARALVGSPIVVKPLGPGHFYQDGDPKIVFTSELRPEDVPAEQFRRAPFLIQERLHGDRHLRVVTVGDRVWACELEASGRSLDWRADEDAHGSFASVTNAGLVEGHALAIARALGCGFSSQDWIVVEGTAYFLDLNPSGQWLFLPSEVATAVTEALASWLVQ
jgi:hypothetical protein